MSEKGKIVKYKGFIYKVEEDDSSCYLQMRSLSGYYIGSKITIKREKYYNTIEIKSNLEYWNKIYWDMLEDLHNLPRGFFTREW